MSTVHKLVVIRHGESTWNKENRFTGWTDVPLSTNGVTEAKEAGLILKNEGFTFDCAYTSKLQRAIHTCWSVLEMSGQSHVDVTNNWRLNERHYGALQGLNKEETAAKHGEDVVKMWRRSYAIQPPALEKSDPRWPGNESIYAKVPKDVLPTTECLKDTVERVLPLWFDVIGPAIMDNKKVLIVAHGNSIRALVKHLENLSEEAILELNIPTGVPLVFELDKDLHLIKRYYLMDEEAVKAKIAAVANQGKAK